MDYTEYLQTKEWREKKMSALDYWGHKCALCYSPDNLHVHHRTYIRIGAELPTDLIVLCDKCHEHHHDIVKMNDKLQAFWAGVHAELRRNGR